MSLHHDPRNEKALALREQLEPRLARVELPEQLAVVLGGDGFMLESIRELGPERLYLGLNCGRLGFTLNDVEEDLDSLVADIVGQRWRVHTIARLSLEGWRPGGEALHAVALNDVYLERRTGQTAHLRIFVDGVAVVERMACDGVIVSTALGSTAYALAAGGAACHFSLDLMQLVAINPHMPRLPAICLRRDQVIEVEVLDGHRRPVRAVTDGVELEQVERVRIRNADSDVRLAFLKGRDPTAALIRKLLHA